MVPKAGSGISALAMLLGPVFHVPGLSYLALRALDAAILKRPALVQSTLFPAFAAGPIVLSGRFWIRPASTQDAWLLCRGLLKILVLLPVVMHFESAILWPLRPNAESALNVMRTLLFYYVRLYVDFSGCSDAVTGLCGLLGLRVRNNFRRPYLATSLRAFWLRWHATLGDFVRRHLYKKLPGGIIIVFLLIGLWHGFAWKFAVFGLWHGAGLYIEKSTLYPLGQRIKKIGGRLAARAYGTILTQSWVMVSWVFFFL